MDERVDGECSELTFSPSRQLRVSSTDGFGSLRWNEISKDPVSVRPSGVDGSRSTIEWTDDKLNINTRCNRRKRAPCASIMQSQSPTRGFTHTEQTAPARAARPRHHRRPRPHPHHCTHI
ncbi:hypothetical protein EVAR_53048_1 [Eumeta japonica]|uniref:Uncharacterized protein n=1 Tax=Eumeta variegata TaxID=151549 RepID=A0A4C1YW78_EUMVA|nr:hypothetical protein EVAR_53048_1 [Eumeta japonica]